MITGACSRSSVPKTDWLYYRLAIASGNHRLQLLDARCRTGGQRARGYGTVGGITIFLKNSSLYHGAILWSLFTLRSLKRRSSPEALANLRVNQAVSHTEGLEQAPAVLHT